MPQIEIFRTAAISIAGTGNSTVISAPGSTNLNPGTTPVPGGGTQQVGAIKVWQIILNGGGAMLVQPSSGGTNIGGPISFLAAGTQVLDYTGCPWITCPAGQSLVFNLSAAGGATGTIYYSIG